METFSFRAECQFDVDFFKTVLSKANPEAYKNMTMQIKPDKIFPDVEVEFSIEGFDLDQIRDVMYKGLDVHVMVQTLRKCRLKDNPLNRDYSIPVRKPTGEPGEHIRYFI